MKLTIAYPAMGRVPGKRYVRSWQMEPLAAAQLASLTPDHWDVVLWDDRMEDIPFDEPTDLVAISVETYTARRAYQIATEYRRRGVPVVMGGFHATLVPDEVKRYAEAVVIGESEETFPRLLADFEAGNLQRVYKAERRPDLSYIMPDRSVFDGKRYLPFALIEAGRGCPMKCDFCAITTAFNATQTARSVESIVEEVTRLKDKTKLFFFVDDNIVSHMGFARRLFRALIPLKIRWVSQATIRMTHDDETLRLMKESGCLGVLIGFESLNPENLLAMNKEFNTVAGGAKAAVEKLNKYGLILYATFMFGYDGDTLTSFKKTIDFCVDNGVFMVAFNHCTPFPGTPLYNRLEAEGRLLYDSWWMDERYKYGQVPYRSEIDPQIIQDECVNARKKFYGLRNTMKRMTNHANIRDPYRLWNYLFINGLLRIEAAQRENYPLGDLRFEGELLEVAEG